MNKANIFLNKEELLGMLKIRENFLYGDFTSKYYEKDVPKKNGGTRKLLPPTKKLKVVQRLILDEILTKYPLPNFVYGLKKDRGILQNAKFHHRSVPYVLINLDLKDFFPNISNVDVNNLFLNLGFSKKCSKILTKITTYNNQLPQGAPTSPYISSLVCSNLDREINNFCIKNNIIYTRYFDDITISGLEIKDEHLRDIEGIISNEKFILNPEKQEVYGVHDSKKVNNILVSLNGVTVTDMYKDELKLLYLKFVQNPEDESMERKFNGKYAFFKHVNKSESITFLKKLEQEHKVPK